MSLNSAKPDVRAQFQLDRAALDSAQPFVASGRLVATGGDAGIWFDIAGANDTVRWMLSELEGQPFAIEATVDLEDGGIHMKDVLLETGTTLARGQLLSDGTTTHGQFTVHRGRASLELTISDGGVSAHLTPQQN